MNYIFLRDIIETLLANFQCPKCSERPLPHTVFIDGISAIRANVRVICLNCDEQTIMQAEVGQLPKEFAMTPEGQEMIDKLRSKDSVPSLHIQHQNPHSHSGSLDERDIQNIADSLGSHATIQELIDDDNDDKNNKNDQ